MGHHLLWRHLELLQTVSFPLDNQIHNKATSFLFRNPKMYLGAAEHLGLAPDKVAMVAAHIYDLRAAASHGMKTVYVRRPTEDGDLKDQVKARSEGGEVDAIVNSFIELASLL